MLPKTCFVVCLFCASLLWAKPDPPAPALPEPAFEPGKETKIEDPQIGGAGYFVVYIPKNYTPDHEWPVIFDYHGMNQKPQTWPFNDLTDGQNFIVIGMEYSDPALGKPSVEKDIPNITRVGAYLSKRLKMNPKLMFIGGFSQGGWETSHFAEVSLETWAGIIITGAGRSSSVPEAQLSAKGIRGKPIFIGVGEKDDNNKSGRSAAAFYTKVGADVTFEEFKGQGHSVDTKDEKLKEWLKNYGPLKQVRQAMEAAQAAEKANKFGEAYTLYHGIGSMPGADDIGVQASKAASAIEENATKKLDAAEEAASAKKFTEAGKAFAQASAAYAGSIFGDKAKKRLAELRSDPSIQADIAQATLDANADQLENAAKAAETAKEYGKAIGLYDRYTAEFAKAHHFAEVKAHLAEMKADKTIMAAAQQGQANVDCKSWMALAENYVSASVPDKARVYLHKIIDKYPATDWAAKARKRLAEIGG